MTDSPAPWSPPVLLPEHPFRFIPVPRERARKAGWTSDRQHAFIWSLARMPSVTAAARSVGMSARSAYRLREAPGAESFAVAWDDALERGFDAARDTAIQRGTEGVLVPVVSRGRIVGTRRKTSDRLLLAVLTHGALEQAGRIAHASAIHDRRMVREADIRWGGPWGADSIAEKVLGPARAARKEAERADREAEARAAARRAANPPRPRGPAVRPL